MNGKLDLILVGGGLANGLLAWRLRQRRPDLNFLIFEQGATLGGEHTWSFHSHDLRAEDLGWLSPLLRKSWESHSVHFPEHERVLHSAYHSISSDRFHEVLAPILSENLRLRSRVRAFDATSVTLDDGSRVEASVVLDGRGPGDVLPEANGYQKFLGFDLTLSSPHGLRSPVLMDARCPQKDGFRFFYLLPWSTTSLLVEDTRYSGSSLLDTAELTAEIHAYVAARGWTISSVDRRESGVLPIPLRRAFAAEKGEIAAEPHSAPRIGMRSDFFHFTTGYSLPWAVRTACSLESLSKFSPEAVHERLALQRAERNSNAGFCRFLNRMLFQAAAPSERYRVLERFYRLPEDLIQRFYSENLTSRDYARILIGKPPVPVHRALQCLAESWRTS